MASVLASFVRSERKVLRLNLPSDTVNQSKDDGVLVQYCEEKENYRFHRDLFPITYKRIFLLIFIFLLTRKVFVSIKREKMNIEESLSNVEKLMDLKKYDDAERLCSDIISFQKDRSVSFSWLAEAFNILGLIMYKKVEFIKAQSLYKKSFETDPSFAPAYYNHGVINYRLGMFEFAVKDFQKAVELDPDNLEFSAGLESSKIALDGLK
ncbi:TPR_REGION domain-containing protein [Trichonephila clavipes]|nr:TPR_REGION domain-containing protein [Trichonephila clavipes]